MSMVHKGSAYPDMIDGNALIKKLPQQSISIFVNAQTIKQKQKIERRAKINIIFRCIKK